LTLRPTGVGSPTGLSRRICDAEQELVFIDAARIAGQIEGIRRAFGREVRHVHIRASRETCAERYEQRRQRAELQEAASYDEVIADPTEAQVDTLGEMADPVIDTNRLGPNDVVVCVAAQLGLLDRGHAPTVDVVIGGSYGSEGKGNIAFHLAPEYDLLVRVGGPTPRTRSTSPPERSSPTSACPPPPRRASRSRARTGRHR
jgi:adenylosuccinate synthase